MIASSKELEVAFRNLYGVEDALEQLRLELQETNPALFPVVSQTYLRRIRSLEADIFDYLRQQPAEVKSDASIAPEFRDRMGALLAHPCPDEDTAGG